MPKLSSAESLLQRQLALKTKQIQLSTLVNDALYKMRLVTLCASEVLDETLDISADIKRRQAYSDTCKERFQKRRRLTEDAASAAEAAGAKLQSSIMLALGDESPPTLAIENGVLALPDKDRVNEKDVSVENSTTTRENGTINGEQTTRSPSRSSSE